MSGSGSRVRPKVEPDPDLFRSRVKKRKRKKDPDPFTYRGLTNDPNPVFNGSKPLGNRIIGDPFTSLRPLPFHNARFFKTMAVKKIKLKYVQSKAQLADFPSKAIARRHLPYTLSKLGIVDI